MTKTKITRGISRATQEILESAEDLHKAGILDDADYRKITMRHVRRSGGETELAPMSGEEIRALRERAHMSQAVFASKLNLTTGYLSQLEREVKRPTGAALALLDVIRRKGIDTIL